MDENTFEKAVYKNWTDYFECPLETANTPGTTLRPESKLDESKLLDISYIGKHTFVRLDPAYHTQLDQLVNKLPFNTSLTGEHIQAAWEKDAVLSRDFGAMYYLFPPELPDYLPPKPYTLRQLSEDDEEAMSALHAANTPEEVDEGYVEVSHQIVFGCFHNGQLVSAASGYERTGFLDIGVLTHPGFRKKGLGKAVVGALCNWSIENGMIAQYRHDSTNISSQKVAASLNFRLYFKTEGFSLK